MADATIEQILEIKPHPNADKLEIATILGYTCVVQKGMYEAGDVVVYIRSDSVLPDMEWATPYKAYAPKRVRIIKLRGEWSEGIVMPMSVYRNAYNADEYCEVGLVVSGQLGITHYEPKAPQALNAKGILPYEIPKTDEERWENFADKLPYGEPVDVTLKIDGQSATYFYKLGDELVGIASRGLELKPEYNNNYTAIFNNYNIGQTLKEFCIANNVSLAIRGEIYGNGVQGYKHNPHSKLPLDFALFSVWLIDERRYARLGDPFYFVTLAHHLGLPTVPIFEVNEPLSRELVDKYSIGIDNIEGRPFEGVVINHANGSFKVINKHYDSQK